MMKSLKNSLLQLIARTSSELPEDVRQAVERVSQAEPEGTLSRQGLDIINLNIDQAAATTNPICQDTGQPTFKVRTPPGTDPTEIVRCIQESVADATGKGYLRPNSVDSLSGKNSGNNLGPGTPTIHMEQRNEATDIEIRLLLKGGGCENKNIQYSLPCELSHLGRADRDLDGVRKCLLHAIWQAQGQGCSPGALGVCIGGDRAAGYAHAKQQLFRPLTDTNSDSRLAQLEEYVYQTANTLGIGTMGFGGQNTLLGCKIGVLNRLPACFFVTVAYNCWAFRRMGILVDAVDGSIRNWMDTPQIQSMSPLSAQECLRKTGQEICLTSPLQEEDVRKLQVGNMVLLSGRMLTARDAAHAYLMKHEQAPTDLRGGALYHCGPVVLQEETGWRMVAAGPTTSIREEPYEADIIRRFGVRAIIGKGGMGLKTKAALQEYGAVYLNAIGGAAQYYSRCVKKVNAVFLLELGIPEAMWDLQVEEFPAIVTMDAHGNSLHDDVEKASALILASLAAKVF